MDFLVFEIWPEQKLIDKQTVFYITIVLPEIKERLEKYYLNDLKGPFSIFKLQEKLPHR